jgi:hypothetical protein
MLRDGIKLEQSCVNNDAVEAHECFCINLVVYATRMGYAEPEATEMYCENEDVLNVPNAVQTNTEAASFEHLYNGFVV